jgi:flagellar biosynthesis chaperone FliJ
VEEKLRLLKFEAAELREELKVEFKSGLSAANKQRKRQLQQIEPKLEEQINHKRQERW